MDAHVHEGFYEAYASLREDLHRAVREEVRRNGVAEIYFTGHSLGGAMATLAAKDFHHNSLPRINAHLRQLHQQQAARSRQAVPEEFNDVRIGIYNFGSPRVGDFAFHNLYNRALPNTFRVVVDGDLVTGVPKNSQGFRHAGTQILIDDKVSIG